MCSKRRMPSNTPIQALAVLNDPAFHECSQILGQRMNNSDAETVRDKIAFGYRAASSKQITPERLTELAMLYDEITEAYQNDQTLQNKLAKTPEEAALTVVASVLLNLDEAITR